MQEEKNIKKHKYIWIFIAFVLVWIIIKIFNNKIETEKKNNFTKENIITGTIATSIISTNTIFRVDIKANGNEPGWFLSINGDTASATALFIADYGDSTFSGSLVRTWQENYDNEFQFRGILSPTATSTIAEQKDFIIYFKKEICTDDAGNTHQYSVEINMHSEKYYKGCADLN